MSALILFLSALAVVSQAHSWLECAKYGNPAVDPPLTGTTYDVNTCMAFPRTFGSRFGAKASHVFGRDVGFNVQPGTNFCDNRPKTYTTDYPMAQYSPGEQVRLVWPAKNHDAEVCTNPFIPDTTMRIYVTSSANGINGPNTLGTAASNPASEWMLLADFKQTQLNGNSPGKTGAEGFQRCPDFCGARGTDKAVCFQDMDIPTTGLLVGQEYTFLWYWVFNQGTSAYTTCWDATIVAGGGGGGGATPSPTTSTTPAPTPQGATTGSPTTTASPTTTTPAPGAEQSLTFQITNTAGTFDQTAMTAAIATQLNVAECKVVTLSFTGQNQNNVQTFVTFHAVNVPAANTATLTAAIGQSPFLNAINAAAGGSNTIGTATAGPPVSDTCTATTTVTISRYTIAIQVAASTAPGVAFSGPLALAIDTALNTTAGINADVSCVGADASTFNCAVIVFTIQDVISASSLVTTSGFLTTVAANIPASATGGNQIAAASLTVSNVPLNAAVGPTSSSPATRLSVAVLFVCLIFAVW